MAENGEGGRLMEAARSFDDAARGVEVRLAELRRLLSGLELAGEQQERIALLLPTLSSLDEALLSVRNELLGAPDGPAFGYERLPEGFTPTQWTTETYVTPVTAAWGQEFAPKPGGDITVDSLFEGDNLERLEALLDNEGSDEEDGEPTSRVPARPIPPATPVGAGRTLADAFEEPRDL